MAATSVVASNLPPATQAWYDKLFLTTATETFRTQQFAQKRPMPANVGDTVKFSRYLPKSARTTALTETDDGGVEMTGLTTQEVSVTSYLYGDYDIFSRYTEVFSITPDKEDKSKIYGNQMADSIDTILRNAVGPAIQRRRPDGDPNYQITGTATATGTTTTLIDTTLLTQADDWWNGAYITFTANTKNYGLTKKITDFVQSTGTLTWSGAVGVATGTSDTYRIVSAKDTTALDIITTSAIRGVKFDLQNNKALTFPGGYFSSILSPYASFDFSGDKTWTDASVYGKYNDLYTGEMGRWLGIRFVDASIWRRENNAGTVSATGDIHLVPFFGRECYGNVDINGQTMPKIYIRDWDQLGQKIPLFYSMGWQVGLGPVVLNGCWGIALVCGSGAS